MRYIHLKNPSPREIEDNNLASRADSRSKEGIIYINAYTSGLPTTVESLELVVAQFSWVHLIHEFTSSTKQ